MALSDPEAYATRAAPMPYGWEGRASLARLGLHACRRSRRTGGPKTDAIWPMRACEGGGARAVRTGGRRPPTRARAVNAPPARWGRSTPPACALRTLRTLRALRARRALAPALAAQAGAGAHRRARVRGCAPRAAQAHGNGRTKAHVRLALARARDARACTRRSRAPCAPRAPRARAPFAPRARARARPCRAHARGRAGSKRVCARTARPLPRACGIRAAQPRARARRASACAGSCAPRARARRASEPACPPPDALPAVANSR